MIQSSFLRAIMMALAALLLVGTGARGALDGPVTASAKLGRHQGEPPRRAGCCVTSLHN